MRKKLIRAAKPLKVTWRCFVWSRKVFWVNIFFLLKARVLVRQEEATDKTKQFLNAMTWGQIEPIWEWRQIDAIHFLGRSWGLSVSAIFSEENWSKLRIFFQMSVPYSFNSLLIDMKTRDFYLIIWHYF